MPIIWMPQAASDLEAIKRYIEQDSPFYARLVAERLFNSVGQLAAFPESGRIVPEVGRPILRELIRGSYRLVYRLDADAIRILTVFRASRLLPADLEQGAR
jgi:plasmid stabilization system protein ParE